MLADLYIQNDDDPASTGFLPRDLIRFFVVDVILIAATRLMLGLGLVTLPDTHITIILAGKLILLLYLIWLIREKRNAWTATGAATIGKWWAWPASIGLYAVAYFALGPISRANHTLMVMAHSWLGMVYDPKPQDVMILIFENILSSQVRIALIVFVVLVGPLMEEFAFRGIGFNAYRRTSGIVRSLLFTSILFGLYHFTLHLAIPLAFLGMIFGLARIMANSLWCAIFIHCLHNALTLAILASQLGVPG